MTRTPRDFDSRDPLERQWLIANTWCDHCNKPDLGLETPTEFDEDGKVFVEGQCRSCGARVKSEIVEDNADE